MVLVFAFSVIGGAALGLGSRAAAFILRMLLFSLALGLATTLSHGWGFAGFAGAVLLAILGSQLGYVALVIAYAARTSRGEDLRGPAGIVLNRDGSRTR